MWQQNWQQPDYNKPPGAGGFDWGSAAQQWLKNKEFYEQWQQQQYQQHLQMMAATHAAQMAQCIDPSVVTNPPPPPPLPVESADEPEKSGTDPLSESPENSNFYQHLII